MAPTHIHARKSRVAELVAQRVSAPQIHQQLIAEGVNNPQTGRPYSLSTVRSDMPAQKPVREMIGRISYSYPSTVRGVSLSVDKTQPDYVFWDKLRRGKARGFEMSGSLAARSANILAAFELAKGMSITLDISDDEIDDAAEARNLDAEEEDGEARRRTDRLLDRFVKWALPQLLTIEEDKLALGDQYVVVNSDGSLTAISPEAVDLEYDERDFRTLTKVKVTTVLEKVTITDEYTASERTVKVKRHGQDKSTTEVTTYANLIGRIPVVHWTCNKGANELYGHPIYEPSYRTLSRWDDLLEKGVDGVELLGNPIPTFTGIDDVDAFLANNGVDTEEYADDVTNQTTTKKVLALDRLPAVIMGTGGEMKMVAPEKGFTTDIEKMLQTLALLFYIQVGIPEFVYGGGMNASRASLETQLPPFVQFIEGLRLQFLGSGGDDFLDVQPSGGLYELIDLWLRVRQLTDPRVIVAPCKVQFPEITPEDAAVMLQKIIYAKGVGLIQKKTTLEKLRLVSDPDEEVRLAGEEFAEEQADDYNTMLNQVARQEVDPRGSQRANRSGITTAAPPDPDGGRNVRLKDGTPVGEITGIDPSVVVVNGNGKPKRKRRRRSPVAA